MGSGSSVGFSIPNPAGLSSSGGSRSPRAALKSPPEGFLVLNLVQPSGGSRSPRQLLKSRRECVFWDQTSLGSGSEGS